MLRRTLKRWFGEPPNEAPRVEYLRPKLAAPSEYTCRLTDRRLLTPETLEISLEPTDAAPFEFLPGQYLNIVVPEDREQQLRRELRSYSIFSHPDEPGPLRLIARLIPGGRTTTWLQQLETGTAVQVVSPFGEFCLRQPAPKRLVFLATGTGLVPIRSILWELLNHDNDAPRHITLMHGLRTQQDIFGAEELQRWAQQHPGFEFITTLSQPEAGWEGATGYVTEHLQSLALSPSEAQVYLCGNGAMVDDAIAILNERGLSRQSGRIVCEKFFDSPTRQLT